MAYTRQVGNRKQIGIRDDVFDSVEEAIKYYDIASSQFYQVKSFFEIDEPHKVILLCLNYGINRSVHRSLNLSKYLEFISKRISRLTELWVRSDSKALSQFLNMQQSKELQMLARKLVEMEPESEALPIEVPEEEPVVKNQNQNAQPSIDFSSFNSEQDFDKIGMQFVLASNIKALKDFIEILEEVSFPIPAEKVYQLHSDLEPIQKMINDSMNIIGNLVEEGKTY